MDQARPLIHQFSPSAEKIALFRALFRGREDVYPRRFESRKTGKSGYAPACSNEWVRGICEKPRVKCAECPNRRFLPVTDEVIRRHLSGRDDAGQPFVAGVYPMLLDETCFFLAVDFDKNNWLEDSTAFIETCRRMNLSAATLRACSSSSANTSGWSRFASHHAFSRVTCCWAVRVKLTCRCFNASEAHAGLHRRRQVGRPSRPLRIRSGPCHAVVILQRDCNARGPQGARTLGTARLFIREDRRGHCGPNEAPRDAMNASFLLRRAQVAAKHALPQDFGPIVGHPADDGRFGRDELVPLVDLEARGVTEALVQLAPPVAVRPQHQDVSGHVGSARIIPKRGALTVVFSDRTGAFTRSRVRAESDRAARQVRDAPFGGLGWPKTRRSGSGDRRRPGLYHSARASAAPHVGHCGLREASGSWPDM